MYCSKNNVLLVVLVIVAIILFITLLWLLCRQSPDKASNPVSTFLPPPPCEIQLQQPTVVVMPGVSINRPSSLTFCQDGRRSYVIPSSSLSAYAPPPVTDMNPYVTGIESKNVGVPAAAAATSAATSGGSDRGNDKDNHNNAYVDGGSGGGGGGGDHEEYGGCGYRVSEEETAIIPARQMTRRESMFDPMYTSD